MAIKFHPVRGALLACDFNGFIDPEMNKKRPVVVLSPRFRTRDRLCTVVPLSTTAPRPVAPYHYKLHTTPPLPAPYDAGFHWVKGDMIYTVSFTRLHLMHDGKDASGNRIYDDRVISADDLAIIENCVLHGLGITR